MSLDLASIVVVTTKGCPYCKKAKALLKEEGYDYSELELTTDKELLQKVKDFTGQRTVPQIFIGNDFMGGASELLKLKDDGLLKEKTEAAKQKQLDSKTKELFTAMQQAKESSESKTYPGCFSKEEYLELQQISESLGDEPLTSKQIEEQTKKCDIQPLIRKLQEANLIVSINPEAKTPEWAQYQTTVSVTGPKSLNQPLNTHFKFYGEARSANVVAGELREMILGLYDKYLSADGKAVDYSGIASDELYGKFYAATAELQKVSLEQLTQSREETMAFFINIYNALIVHGTVVHGIPPSVVARVRFFGKVSYEIGGYKFSADDMEHGILRNNAVSPASIGSLLGIPFFRYNQFQKGDARIAYKVSPKDPRIHFALVCGAKSCPPIKLYTPTNLDEGLESAAVSFVESEVVLKDDNTLEMSKIFDWYGADFGSKLDLVKFIQERANEPLKQQLGKFVEEAQNSGGKLKLKFSFKTYDWGANEKEGESYTAKK